MQHEPHPRDPFDTLGITDCTSLRAGVNPKVVSERLGHSSVAFTLDVYSHAVPALHAEAATLIAAVVFDPGPRASVTNP